MNKLHEYLRARKSDGLKAKEFAKSLGITEVSLSRIRKGLRRPSYDLMLRIRDQTRGAVPLDAWEDQ